MRISSLRWLSGFALFLTLAFGANPAPAQTAQTAIDLLGGLSIPGLDALPVSNVKIADGVKSADLNLHGHTATLVVFKPEDGAPNVAAIVPQAFNIADFVPLPSGTPLDGVAFSDMALVVAQGGVNFAASAAPEVLRAAFSHGGGAVSLKAGVNLFGQADVSSGGKIKDLLSLVGVSELTLPLNGTLPLNLFSQDPKSAAADFRNRILDNLNLTLPLPALKPPGAGNAVAFQQALLTLKGGGRTGARSIELDIGGELDLNLGNKSVSFAFDMDVVTRNGQKRLKITATDEQRQTLAIPMFIPVELENMSFATDNEKTGGWRIRIKADATVNGQQLNVTYAKDPGAPYRLDITPENLTLDKLIGASDLPGLDDVVLTSVEMYPGHLVIGATLKGAAVDMRVQKNPNGTGRVIAVSMSVFSPARLIPGAEATPLKDATFKNLVLLYNPTGQGTTLSGAGLETDIVAWVTKSNANPALKPGMNIFGHLQAQASGELADLLAQVGVSGADLPLSGSIGKSVFSSQAGASVKDAILANLDIKLPLPAISIPGLPGDVTFGESHLHITAPESDGKRSIDVDIKGGLSVQADGKSLAMNFDTEYSKASGLKFSATTTPGETVHFPALNAVSMRNIVLGLDKKAGAWVVALDGEITLNGRTLDVTYLRDPRDRSPYIRVNTKSTLADLVGGPGLPGLDDVELDWIQIKAGFFLMHAKIKGVDSYLYAQPSPSGSGHYIAAYLSDMNLGGLIPGISGTPLKDVDFSDMVLFYSPAGSPVSLDSSRIIGEAAAWIRQSSSNPTLKPGMNVFGYMHVRSGGEMKSLLGKVGISDAKLPLHGKLDRSILQDSPTAAIKSELLNALDLNIPLPPLKIAGVDKFVSFSSGRLIVKGKTPDGKEGIFIDFSGDAALSGHGSVAVDVEFDRAAGGQSDFWVELKGPVNLGDLPGANALPHAGHFDLADLKISAHGIEADTDLNGKSLDVALFETQGWNAALSEKQFSITEIIPGIAHTPLKHIEFPEATLVISESGIDKHLGDLSPIAQDGLKIMYPNQGDFVQIASGLTFMAGFHPDNAGAMKDAVKGLGIHDGISVVGEIGGIFGGTPMVKLKGTLGSSGPAGNMPSSMSYKTTENIDFFITVLESGQDFDFELGLGVDIAATIAGDHLDFQGKTKIQVMDEGFGIDVEASMLGTWHTPFNIPFSMSDITVEVGTQEDGALKMGFSGKTNISGDDFAVAGDGEFLPEALGAPQAIAFKASASEVDMFFLDEVAFSMVSMATGRAGVRLPISKIPQPKIKNALFAFATPGAEDPDLGIISEGFALKGTFEFLGRELGDVDAVVGPSSGLKIKGDLDDFDLGPLVLKNNKLDVEVPFKKIPSFKIHADLEFLEVKDRFEVVADNKEMIIKVNDKFGPDFVADFDLRLRGVDLNSGKYDKSNADFYVKGLFEAKFADFMKDSAKKTTDGIFDDLNKAFDAGKKVVEAAKAKVETWTHKLNAERAKVRRERAKAEAKVQDAENRVNSLNGDLNHAWHKYHHCHGWFGWTCRIKWGIEIAGIKASLRIADGVLDAVKSGIAHFPIDLDPRVAALIISQHAAIWALDIALEAIKGLDVLDRFLKEATDAIDRALGEALGHSININELAFEGDLRGIIEHDAPLDLTVDIDFFGERMHEKFAFKVKDLAWDAEQLGLLGLYTLEHVVDDVLKDLPSALTHRVRSSIASKIEDANVARNKALAAAANTFSAERKLAAVQTYADETAAATAAKIHYNQYAAKLRARFDAAEAAYVKSVIAAQRYNPLDHAGPSLSYSDDYFEVGHTGLCLTAEDGELVQHPCKGGKSAQQRWTTVPVMVDGKDTGYVHITQNGQCLSPEGKWVEVTETFGDGYTFKAHNFQGDGELSVGGCYKDSLYDWKILRHGTDWVRMVNRVTSHCVHFENSDAVPGNARAVWGPCTGTANQVYRVANKLTPIYHKAGFALRNDFNSLCFGDGDPDVKMVDCTKKEEVARYDYVIDFRGDIKFINVNTGNCLQPQDYTLGTALTERECTQLDYQWWEVIHLPGGWSVKNAQTKHCDMVGTKAGEPAMQGGCANWSQAILVPLLDPTSGFKFKDVTYVDFPVGDAAYNINFTPAERKYNYDQWLQRKISVKMSADREKIGTEQMNLNENHRYKQCDKVISNQYWQYREQWQGVFEEMDEVGGQCHKAVTTTETITCPPAAPPPTIKQCFTFAFGTFCMGNQTVNPDYTTWSNQYGQLNSKIAQAGIQCSPGDSVTLTERSYPPNDKPWIPDCPPPAPPQYTEQCYWTFGQYPPAKQKKIRAEIKKTEADLAKLTKQYQAAYRNTVIPPPEAPQYLCRAKHSGKFVEKISGFFAKSDSLIIGLVKARKCVVVTNLERRHAEFTADLVESKTHYYAKPEQVSTNEYQLLTKMKDLVWKKAYGTLPETAVALGYISNRTGEIGTKRFDRDTGLESIYACRVITNDGNTTVGWSVTGADCSYPYLGGVNTVMEDIGTAIEAYSGRVIGQHGISILVRKPKDFYHVDLNSPVQ